MTDSIDRWKKDEVSMSKAANQIMREIKRLRRDLDELEEEYARLKGFVEDEVVEDIEGEIEVRLKWLDELCEMYERAN